MGQGSNVNPPEIRHSTMLPNRLASLDIARGLSAFSVVLWHWQHFYFHGTRPSSEFDRKSQPLYWLFGPFFEHGGVVAVSFFFALSGFVFFWLYADKIAQGKCTFWRFSLLRLARLYPLHAVTLLLVLFLQWLRYAQTSDFFIYSNNDAYHFFLHLLMVPNWGFEKGYSFNAPFWSVSIEVGLYLLFFLIAYWKRHDWKTVLAIIIIAGFVGNFGVAGHWPNAIESFFLGGLCFYVINSYQKCVWRKAWIDMTILLAPLLIWAACYFFAPVATFVFNDYRIYVRVLFPLTISGLVLLECSERINFQRFQWIGDITYSSYLLHFPLQLGLVLLVTAVGVDVNIYSSAWTLVFFTAVLLPISLGSFLFFERPVQRWIRQRYMTRSERKQGKNERVSTSFLEEKRSERQQPQVVSAACEK